MWNFSLLSFGALLEWKMSMDSWNVIILCLTLICLLITGFCHLLRFANEQKCKRNCFGKMFQHVMGLWEIECGKFPSLAKLLWKRSQSSSSRSLTLMFDDFNGKFRSDAVWKICYSLMKNNENLISLFQLFCPLRTFSIIVAIFHHS